MRPEYYGMMNEYTIEGREYGTNGLCLGIIGKSRHGETKNIAMEFHGPTMTIRTHSSGISTFQYEPKNISVPTYNNARQLPLEKDDLPTMDEKDLY